MGISSSQYIYLYYVPSSPRRFSPFFCSFKYNLYQFLDHFVVVLFVCVFSRYFFLFLTPKLALFCQLFFMYFLFIFWAVWKDKNMNVSTCKSDFHLLLVLNNCFIIKSNLNTTNTCHISTIRLKRL